MDEVRGAEMRVETACFGQLDIPEEATLYFLVGIFGFEELREYCLLPYKREAGLRWLQSLHDPAVVFLTVEPYLVFPEYEVDLPEREKDALGLQSPEESAVLVLLTISAETGAVSANLLAPIVINIRTRKARQVVLECGRYGTKHLIGGAMGSDNHAGVDAEDG